MAYQQPELYTNEEWARLTPEQQARAAAWWATLDATTKQQFLANKRPLTPEERAMMGRAVPGNPRGAATIPGFPSSPDFRSGSSGGFSLRTMPDDGTFSPSGDGSSSGGFWDWVKSVPASDWIKVGGSLLGGYLGAKNQSDDRAQREREFTQSAAERAAEFARTQGASEAQLAVRAESALNKVPMLDKSTALLMARMGAAPSSYHPRDYTQGGTAALNSPASGGYAPTVDATALAARNYLPGQGGVKTDALEALKRKFMLSSGLTTV